MVLGIPLVLWFILIFGVGLLLLLLLYLLYYGLLKRAGAFPPLPCRLITYTILRDECAGACPAGQECVATGTKPYGPWGIFGTQPTGCTCRPSTPGPIPPGGGSTSGH
jgi:hypothetical protein